MTKEVQHKSEVRKDSMGEVTLHDIVLPSPSDGSPEEQLAEVEQNFVRFRELVAQIVESMPDERTKSIRDARDRAVSFSDDSQDPLSFGYLMRMAHLRIDEALEDISHFSQEEREVIERALHRVFYAGLKYQSAKMRELHLADVEREAGMKKSRAKGGQERARAQRNENRELFAFMEPKIEQEGNSVMTVATWAAKKGLGASNGTIEQRADANRQRYRNRPEDWKKL